MKRPLPSLRTSRRATGIALTLLIGLAVLGAFSAVEGKDVVFKIQWKDRDLVIDGKNGDWQGALGYLNDPPVMLGFLNDDNSIYICLATNLPAIREGLLRGGITVWIDPKGGKRKTLGIRLASSVPPGGPGDGRRGGQPEGPEERTGQPPTAPPEGAFERDGAAPSGRLMVRLPGRNDWAPVEGGAGGIEAAIEESNGLAVFEMMVPLRGGPAVPVAIGAGPGATVSMSFETPKPERPKGRPGPGGDRTGHREVRGGINGPPGSGMEEPGGFGRGMEDPFKNTEGLKLRVEMKLASR